MRKYLNILIYICIMILPKTTMANNHSLYSFAGILPIIKDNKKQTWIYLGVEYVNNEKRLALLAGQRDKKDANSMQTALREMNEESLDVFSDYITIKKLTNDGTPEINYNILYLLSTKVYLFPIISARSNGDCDSFIKLYNERRYAGSDKYKRLRLAQRETYELRKVKLVDLIDFLNKPSKFNYKLISYGGKGCNTSDSIPLRWSTKIILKNQSVLEQFVK